jgi:hypothetical protein
MLGIYLGALAALLMTVLCLRRPRKPLCALTFGVLFLASLLNGMAMLANGGKMPVKRPHYELPASDKTHVDLTKDSRLVALTDIYGGYHVRYSLGDVFCTLAIFLFVGSLLVPKSWRL